MRVTRLHRLDTALWTPSLNWEERPSWAQPELVVIHCISLPENEFGSGAPQRLFLGTLDPQEHESFADLVDVKVSPHVLIDRLGNVQQFVGFDKQAWHAGVSQWNCRSLCNQFSIGIELEGSVSMSFTASQYNALNKALTTLLRHYPSLCTSSIVGHCEIAPGRKFDPGPHFDWARVLSELQSSYTI